MGFIYCDVSKKSRLASRVFTLVAGLGMFPYTTFAQLAGGI